MGARVCKNQTLLIEAGADINKADDDGVTPLYIAVEKGHRTVVRTLIEKGADIKIGSTPLYIAKQMGHHAVVRALTEAGRANNKI